MIEHYSAVEADFQRDYGLHLGELLWGPKPITARRLVSLVVGLQPKGAVHRALDERGWFWDMDTELTAVLAESVDRLDNHFVRANFKDAKPRPLEIPRPWKDDKPKGTTLNEFKQILGRSRVNQ